jgi:DNA-binding GntR family transcriptional regulator
MSSLMVHFDRVRSLSLQTIKELKIVNDHTALLEAIKARDKQRALAVISEHLQRYRVDEDILKKEYPDYFED